MTAQEVYEMGVFNGWKGCIDLYFTQKKIRSMKKYGILSGMTIKQVYDILKQLP